MYSWDFAFLWSYRWLFLKGLGVTVAFTVGIVLFGLVVGQLAALSENVRAEELASRLKTARQDALRKLRDKKDLADGKIDIIVGTHALLGKSIKFKDLGLLIVDAEEHFGVSHKERLKKLRTQVDTLTLTATPIPRTLHMAMSGLRDLSIITTAPADRKAIRTLVARASDDLIKEGVKRELARGGQVFFVHNRVETIGKWALRLRELRR